MSDLSFGQLREANLARLPLFKNGQGLPAHSQPDGSDWSSAQWLQAVLGELGELANVMKKVDRGDFDLSTTLGRVRVAELLAGEIADVQIYLDLLAYRLGLDLGRATREKWNAKSAQLDIALRLGPEGVYEVGNEGGSDGDI